MFTGIDRNGNVFLNGNFITRKNNFKAQNITLPESHILEEYKTDISYLFLFNPEKYKKLGIYPSWLDEDFLTKEN